MSPDIAQIITLMEWAARQDLRRVTQDDGRLRVTLRRRPAGAVVPEVLAAEVPDATGIAAPLAGVCHLAPDPASAPFVRAGDRVAAGQTLCLIEAMKVMTAVTAPCAGVVEGIAVADGAAVVAGAVLMRVAP